MDHRGGLHAEARSNLRFISPRSSRNAHQFREISLFFLRVLVCTALLPSVCPAETREAKELSALEPKVVYLCERARFGASEEMRSYWRALSDPSLETVNLVALLKSSDPKIRSLAIFALDRRYDPRLLAKIAPLQSDQTLSYRCPMLADQRLPPDKPQTWPSQPQTVGDLAGEVVHRYLKVSGSHSFSDYWAEYKGRDYSAVWFILELRRAWDPFNHTGSGIDAIRREVALVPSPDRQWTILCLGTLSSPNRVTYPYSEDDVLRAAAELGHDRLIQLIEGRIESTDPAFAAPKDSSLYHPYWERLQAMQIFVLSHAKNLLRSSDVDVLLQFPRSDALNKNSWELSYGEWWPIAAASVKGERSTTILDEAQKRWPESANISLVRWRIEGPLSFPDILHWFNHPGRNAQGDGPQEALTLAIQRARPNRYYEPLVRSILTSSHRLSIDGEAMYRFAALAQDWKVDFGAQFVDWIYAQPPDAHPELMGPPRELVVRVSGVAKKLIQDQRFLRADAQLLYDIEQSVVGNLNLSRSESVRLGQLISKIDLRYPEQTTQSDRAEIRILLRKGISDN